MQDLADESCEVYRDHVHRSPDFFKCARLCVQQCCYGRMCR